MHAASQGAKTKRRRPFDERTITAYHEAGHAVLSSAINDMPAVVSIRETGLTLGYSEQRLSARATSVVQVYLAGFAAEHLLTGRRPRQLDREVGFALLARMAPKLRAAFEGCEGQDGYRAVDTLVRMGCPEETDAVKGEVARYYAVARVSLRAVWPGVVAVAEALLEREELDRDALENALGEVDVYSTVFRVQRAHGLLLPD